jgi:hypothetical protein
VTIARERPPRGPVCDGFIDVEISDSGWRRRGDARDGGDGGARPGAGRAGWWIIVDGDGGAH